MYICLCRAVTDDEIKKAIKSGSKCIKSLQCELGVSTQCGACLDEVYDILHEALLEDPTIPTPTVYLPVVVKQDSSDPPTHEEPGIAGGTVRIDRDFHSGPSRQQIAASEVSKQNRVSISRTEQAHRIAGIHRVSEQHIRLTELRGRLPQIA